MLKIKNAKIETSAVKPEQYPEDVLPEIVLLGRSNAGKSSLINALINRKNLARTSSAPGKTRLLNFYRIDAGVEDGRTLPFFFVDLPGYGYAKVAKTERAEWLSRIERFLLEHQDRLLCWQLVDIRHEPSKEDVAMNQALREAGFHIHVVANKADKISKNVRAKNLKVISQTLQVPLADLTVFSAISREGREELLAQAAEHILDYYGDE
jgi:GTP-binding protein